MLLTLGVLFLLGLVYNRTIERLPLSVRVLMGALLLGMALMEFKSFLA